jgi:hypothetical protein
MASVFQPELHVLIDEFTTVYLYSYILFFSGKRNAVLDLFDFTSIRNTVKYIIRTVYCGITTRLLAQYEGKAVSDTSLEKS